MDIDFVDPRDDPTSTSISFDEVDELHLRVGAMCLLNYQLNYSDDEIVRLMTSVKQKATACKECMTESSFCFNPEDAPIQATVEFNNKLKTAITMAGWKPSELIKKLKPDTLARLKELEGKINSQTTNYRSPVLSPKSMLCVCDTTQTTPCFPWLDYRGDKMAKDYLQLSLLPLLLVLRDLRILRDFHSKRIHN